MESSSSINFSSKTMGMPGVLCKVCGDRASGKHYGVPSCDGCRGFFKRSIRRNLDYSCKEGGKCIVDVSRRNQCQACRFAKCLQVNMRREAVQHERAPRNCPTTHNLLHTSSVPPELYSFSDMALPHPSFLLPFAPLPSFYLSNYESARFHPSYTSSSTFWDTLNLSSTYGSQALAHQSLLYKPSMTTSAASLTPTESLTPLETRSPVSTVKLSTAAQHQIQKEEEVEVTSSEEMETVQNGTKTAMDLLPETTAKIFMLVMKWIKAMPSFMQLPMNDKKLMIEAAWAELVVVTAAQYGLPIQPEDTSDEDTLRQLQSVFYHFQRLKVEQKEYSYLKALILYRPDTPGVYSFQQCLLLQEQTLSLLYKSCMGSLRLGHLLMLLLHTRDVTRTDVIKDILSKALSENSVENIIEDTLKL